MVAIRHTLRCVLSLACATLLGCGGKFDPTVDTIKVTAAPTTVPYGGTTIVNWKGAKAQFVQNSNFGVTRNQTSGMIDDQPGATATYWVTVYSDSGNSVRGETTVAIERTSKSFVLVGDTSHAQMPTIGSALRTITLEPPVTLPSIPPPSYSGSVLVVHESGSFTAEDALAVKGWLDAGKGVVLLGIAPVLIATGDPNNRDLSAISSWFGGATSLNVNGAGRSVRTELGDVCLSRTIRGKQIVGAPDVMGLNAAVDRVVPDWSGQAQAFAFRPQSGGRLFYCGRPFSSANPDIWRSVFLSGAMWAAQGQN